MQLNLANCVPTLNVISRNFYGISFCVNHVLYIVVMQPSKFSISLRNEVPSTINRGVYASADRIIVLPSNCNCLSEIGYYGFPECANVCMITTRRKDTK